MSRERARFVTLFPGAHDYHLTKDVGMIPYVLGRYFGYEAWIASFENDPVYPSLRQLPGLAVEVIPRESDDEEADVLAYLEREAPGIDVLQIYHWLPHVLDRVATYKASNPAGTAWLKLDANSVLTEESFGETFDRAQQGILRSCDLVTVESRELHERLAADWPVPVEYVPNGFYDGGRRVAIPYDQKADVVCTVGRLGTHQKATETLLEAFARARALIGGYELRLVGSVEPEFVPWIETFFERHPDVRERIVFTGESLDRARVDAELRRARVFCLPSRWEGFGLVLAEALAAGCWLVSSDTPAAPDITGGGRFGEIFPADDVDALTTCLLRACTPGDDSGEISAAAQDFAYEAFYWPEIGAAIHRHLERVQRREGGTVSPAGRSSR